MRLATRTSVVRPWSLTRPPHRRCVAADQRYGSADGMRRDATGPDAGLGLALMSASHDLLRLSPEVREALETGGAVVALESTLITHGLAHARRTWTPGARARRPPSVPAGAIARHDRHCATDSHSRVGLDACRATRSWPTRAGQPTKVARQNLAAQCLTRRGWARHDGVGRDRSRPHLAGIRRARDRRHRRGAPRRRGQRWTSAATWTSWRARPVTCGVRRVPKSILDVGRTLEALETRGVPVVGHGRADEVAGFFSRSSGHRAPPRIDTADEAARLITTQRNLGLSTGVLITVPLPDSVALPTDEVANAVEQAEAKATASGIHGPASTPFILTRVAALTDGRSVRANVVLMQHNAKVAGRIPVALMTQRDGQV